MTEVAPEVFSLPVPGGQLAVGRWPGPPGAPTVVAAHGITANHVSFDLVARALMADVTVVAPDLRGRGRSNGVTGPFGITAHADDVVALLDHLEVERATIVGHSMGAWVATCTAVRHPGRVDAVVLVDGGLALPLAEGLDVDTVLQAVLGPSIARLSMTFADGDAYRAFWQQHPAVGGAHWSDLAEAYVDYDLEGTPPDCRSSVSIDAVRGDATEQLSVPEVRDAVEHLTCPAHLLFAPRGLLDGDPLYPPEALDALRPRWPTVVHEEVVPDTNHFTIVLGAGAPTVAATVRGALQRL
ncbi:MAG: alpha/beta hydrolase [Acidimicrobiales bacterium]